MCTVVLHPREAVAHFHADEAAPDHDDFFPALGPGGFHDGLRVVELAQQEDIPQIALEPVDGQVAGHAAGGEDELGVGVLFAGFRLHFLRLEIDARDLVGDVGDIRVLVEVLRAPRHFREVRDERFGELRAVDGLVVLPWRWW